MKSQNAAVLGLWDGGESAIFLLCVTAGLHWLR